MQVVNHRPRWTILMKTGSFVIAIICMLLSNRIAEQFWIIPCLYALLMVVCQYNTALLNTPGALVMNAVMFMRYDILPLAVYLTEESSRFVNDVSFLSEAVYLMAYEMICIFLALELSGRKYYVKELRYEQIGVRKIYHVRDLTLIVLVVVLALFGIALTYKDLIGGLRIVLCGSVGPTSSALRNNAVDIVWQVLCVWLYTYFLFREAWAYELDTSRKHAKKVVVYTFLFVLICFIESSSLSRWYIIVSAGASIACVFHLFPSYRKKITLIVLVPAALLLVLMTVYKNGGYVLHSECFLESVWSVFDVSTLDSYFCGPFMLNSAIGLKETSSLGFSTIICDALNNMPIVNHYIQSEKTSVYAFAAYSGRLWGNGGDLIIPLIGQSSIYFGYVFSPILSVLSVLMVRYFDFRFKRSSSCMMYFYAFASIWYAVTACMLNFTINLSWVYIRLVPFAIVLSITSKLAGRLSIHGE